MFTEDIGVRSWSHRRVRGRGCTTEGRGCVACRWCCERRGVKGVGDVEVIYFQRFDRVH